MTVVILILIPTSAPKSCELDPIPSKILIECLDSILPSLTDLFNSSLASGIFPQCFKSALVTPILKKRCLDLNDLNNYRPVSNLCFIAKILEKLVLSQVSSYLNSHNLYNTCQSAYRPGHSTETALLKVVNDLFLSLYKGNISVLALLDFSSALDTIDHTILVHRLHTDFGFTDTVLQWFYLINIRQQPLKNISLYTYTKRSATVTNKRQQPLRNISLYNYTKRSATVTT